MLVTTMQITSCAEVLYWPGWHGGEGLEPAEQHEMGLISDHEQPGAGRAGCRCADVTGEAPGGQKGCLPVGPPELVLPLGMALLPSGER